VSRTGWEQLHRPRHLLAAGTRGKAACWQSTNSASGAKIPRMATNTSTDDSILVIHSTSPKPGFRVKRIAEFLNALEEAHNGLLLFEAFLNDYISWKAEAQSRDRNTTIGFDSETGALAFSVQTLSSMTPEDLRKAGDKVTKRAQLRIHAIEVGSPDFWSVFGSLNPLEQIRKWVDEAHKRRQDREYREAAERERLRLENIEKANKIAHEEVERSQKIENEELNLELKRLTVYEGKIRIAKEVGIKNKDLAPVVRTLVSGPRKQLEQFNDIIEGVELGPSDGESGPKSRP
jgi:hypothetical protein